MFKKGANYKVAMLFLLFFCFFKSFSAHADTLANNSIITNDPIHPYIYELMQTEDVNKLNFTIMSNNENVTEKFKNQIKSSSEKLNASIISELMDENQVIFVNKSPENTDGSNETARIPVINVLREQQKYNYVYDENYQNGVLVEYIAAARWQVHIGENNKISYAGAGNLSIEAATPYNTDIFSQSHSFSLMNNGYTSKLIARYTIKTGFSNSQHFWYKISKPLNDIFYYHSITS